MHLPRADEQLDGSVVAHFHISKLATIQAAAAAAAVDLAGTHDLGDGANIVSIHLIAADDQQRHIRADPIPKPGTRQHRRSPHLSLGLPAARDGAQAAAAHKVLAGVVAEALGGGAVCGARGDGEDGAEVLLLLVGQRGGGGGAAQELGQAGFGLLEMSHDGQHEVAAGRLARDDDVGGRAVEQEEAQGGEGLGELAGVDAFGREGVLEED